MSISTRQKIIVTSHGSLAVEETVGSGIPVLLIHGNSLCRGVFRSQMQGHMAAKHRFIAFYLPGSRTVEQRDRSPTQLHATRTCRRYGRVARQIGCSRGYRIWLVARRTYWHGDDPACSGHARTDDLRRPPVSASHLSQGFNTSPHLSAAGNPELTESGDRYLCERHLR